MLRKVLASGQVAPPGGSLCKTLEDTEGHLAHNSQHTHGLLQTRSAFAQCLPQACAKACESPKTPSKASDASEWSAPMACVGGTASAARLKRPKSSAQRGDGLEVAAIRILEELANLRLRRAFRFAGGSDADRPSRFWTLS